MALRSTLTRSEFLSQVTKPWLIQQKDLIFDYDNLKACLDPTNEFKEDEPSENAVETKVLHENSRAYTTFVIIFLTVPF